MMAAKTPFLQSSLQAISQGNLPAIKMILDKGEVDIDEAMPHDAIHGHLDLIKLLIFKGANINAKNEMEQTPLELACASNKLEAVSTLLSRGASVTVTDSRGWTPLHFAAYLGNIESMMMLLNFGADRNAVSQKDETPLKLLRLPHHQTWFVTYAAVLHPYYNSTNTDTPPATSSPLVLRARAGLSGSAPPSPSQRVTPPSHQSAPSSPSQRSTSAYPFQQSMSISVSASAPASPSAQRATPPPQLVAPPSPVQRPLTASLQLEQSPPQQPSSIPAQPTEPPSPSPGEHTIDSRASQEQLGVEKRKNAELLKQIEEQRKKIDELHAAVSVSPARVALEAHLISVRKLIGIGRMNLAPKKLFISYAWYIEEDKKTALHARLRQLKADLISAGANVVLDLENMQGDINKCI